MITFDHINVEVPLAELGAVRDFLVMLVGLEDGTRPQFDFPGHWLYMGGRPVVHLAGRGAGLGGKGWVDHVAFAGFSFDAEVKRLDALGITYVVSGIPGGARQLFVSGPAGLKVELQCTA